jgi:DNA invertase Pin-like site-specific DNA recombinase
LIPKGSVVRAKSTSSLAHCKTQCGSTPVSRAKLVELFDAHGVSFVSVTQQFNTTTSMGRLTLNVLLSFAN